MHSWILHHLRFAIFVDAILHSLILGCVIAAWVYFIQFAKIVYKAAIPSLKVILCIMGLIMVYMTVLAAYDAYICLHQYASWWNR